MTFNSLINVLAGALLLLCGPMAFAQNLSTEMSSPLPENANTLRVENPAAQNKKFSGKWQAEMGGEGMDQGKDEGFASHFGLYSEGDYRLSPIVSFRASGGVDYYTSRLQERIKNDDYTSHLYFSDSYIQVEPLKWLELRGGALSQRFLDMPLLVSRGRAFPGFVQMLHFDFGDKVHMDVVGQQTIPTSRSLNDERDERESLPWFMTQSVHLRVQPVRQANFTLWGGHYQWQNLPSKVAFDSQVMGNQATGELAPNAHFAYAFDGLFGGLKACYCDSGVPFNAEIAFTRFANMKAPEDRRNGQMIEVSPSWDAKFWNLKLTYSYFFNESDSTPAYYNPSRYGNNNREGSSVELKLHLKPYQFSVFSQYVVANPINFDPNQQRLTSMLLGVETDYESF